MSDQERFEAYLKICQKQYERLVREGRWPWTDDSTEFEDVIDSEDNS